jgi:hypothetical protein
MSGRLTVQRLPRGLLDALLMKGTGDLPHELGEELVSTIDATSFYLGDTFRAQSSLTNVCNAVGAYSGLTLGVPPGEIWIPTALSVLTAALGAGQTYNVSPAIFRNNFNAFEILPAISQATAGQAVATGWQFGNMTQLRPGDAVGCHVNQVTAGATAMGIYISYYRVTF